MSRPPVYDPRNRWLVSSGYLVDGEDMRRFSQHCCRRAAEDHAAYLRRRAEPNVTVTEQRPVPRKGAMGGWRLGGTHEKHVCSMSYPMDADEYAAAERRAARRNPSPASMIPPLSQWSSAMWPGGKGKYSYTLTSDDPYFVARILPSVYGLSGWSAVVTLPGIQRGVLLRGGVLDPSVPTNQPLEPNFRTREAALAAVRAFAARSFL